MAKSIYLTDAQYASIVKQARRRGYEVKRGRGSQLAVFITLAAANNTIPSIKTQRRANEL